MKTADDWVKDAMHRLEMSWHADYHCEMVGEVKAAAATFARALQVRPEVAELRRQLADSLSRAGRHA